MCFLYRQSISIVYESKFKYIYRYFIKIDRCFCGILQSLPLRKCGLKSVNNGTVHELVLVTSLAEVWIEISNTFRYSFTGTVTSLAEVWIEIGLEFVKYSNYSVTSLAEVWIEILFYSYLGYRVVSLPLRKCGLKCQKGRSTGRNTRSLPLRKCGLKWSSIQILNSVISVTSLAEVWIEID